MVVDTIDGLKVFSYVSEAWVSIGSAGDTNFIQ